LKLICSPLSGSRRGGRKLSEECGTLNLNFLTCRPMRFSDNNLLALKVLGRKVMSISLKQYGDVVAAKLWQTSRIAGSVSRSTLRSSAFLQFSESQNRKNVELVDMTRLHVEFFEKLAVMVGQICTILL
jgi:hypothetical protein